MGMLEADEYGDLEVADVTKTVRGLEGRYPASEIYKKYRSIVLRDGRLPAHPSSLGRHLGDRGFTKCRLTRGGKQVAAWRIGKSLDLIVDPSPMLDELRRDQDPPGTVYES
jgi:hypothetical protein